MCSNCRLGLLRQDVLIFSEGVWKYWNVRYLSVFKPLLYFTVHQSAITKYHRLSGLNSRNLLFLILWKLQVQDQGISRLISPEASFLGLQPPPGCALPGSVLCVHAPLVSLCVSKFSFLVRTPVRLG